MIPHLLKLFVCYLVIFLENVGWQFYHFLNITFTATRRRTPKPRDLEPDVNIPPPEQAEMLIMGIIRDKKEQKFHEAHQVKIQNDEILFLSKLDAT